MRAPYPRIVSLAALAAIVACSGPPPLFATDAPSEVREACNVMIQRCTACHETDRIAYARHTQEEWLNTVNRMRRFPGSGISPDDVPVIMRCLSPRAQRSLLEPIRSFEAMPTTALLARTSP